MKKRLSCLILAIIMICSFIPSVSAAGSVLSSQGKTLYELGLFRGVGTNEDGTPDFGLDQVPTRNQALIMLVRLLGKEEEALAGTWSIPFKDVSENMRPYVGYAYTNGLTNGTTATTYSGAQPIKVNQYITFVLRALGYESGVDFTVSSPWEFARQVGIMEYQFSEYTTRFDRGDMALLSGNALTAPQKGSGAPLIQKLVAEGAVDGEKALLQGLPAYPTDIGTIHYIYDIRSFTLYAFMNHTGYDSNNNYAIAGVRQQLREDLAAINPSISEPNYAAKHKIKTGDVLTVLGDAPEFQYISTDGIQREVWDLPEKLAEFYVAADIPALYEKYRPHFEQSLSKYKAAMSGILSTPIKYFRLEGQLPEEVGFEVLLLEAAQSGHARQESLNLYNDYPVFCTGPVKPSDKDGINQLNVVHEYFHIITRPMLERCSEEMDALSRYYKKGTEASSWEDAVNESVVRAISAYFVDGSGRANAMQADEKGYVMATYIFDRIPEFASFDGDLEDFLRMLLVEYPEYR